MVKDIAKEIGKDFNCFQAKHGRDPEYLVLGIRKPNGKVKILKHRIYQSNKAIHFEVNDKENKSVNHPDTKILNYMLV
ncbi:hypothetical protein K0O13_08310 [Mammaliicoccus sciuri]|uniref:hypothetical protein n=1 Tax=Mammaliicoccus sciuri TaxID=1296 RepID=UPI001C63652B|nr:hypothetical protein [Mammaliicoccus sciuri]QYG30103.1 hypothetical protein K0O13_08310 [Mammaliicoccus sciuri]